MAKAKLKVVEEQQSIKLDIGCGKNKQEGFIGVDQYKMDNVDVVMKIGTDAWPWADSSVEEVHCSHFLEHLNAQERVHFCNELYRVMKKGARATIITPHWASLRAYGDPTHQWPPVSEMWIYYLSKEWRKTQAPHTDKEWNSAGFDCDFDATCGYGMHPGLMTRNEEYRQFALSNYKEAAQDLHTTLVKK